MSTKNINVYTPDQMKETILSLEDELTKKTETAIENIKGPSGWSPYQHNKIYNMLRTNKTPRAGSYIKTPENIIILTVD